jgi:hypothetical protein
MPSDISPVILLVPLRQAGTHDNTDLMRRLGCTRVLDHWNGSTPLQPGDLAITSMPLAELERVCMLGGVPANTRIMWVPRTVKVR